jgi:pimeloyl-ACP methyl ester carboxylesterase
MPILVVGAEKSFGSAQADDIRFVATDVTAAIVPDFGHWVMEENPNATTRIVVEFLAK